MIPSHTSILESARVVNMDSDEFVRDYVSLPMLPRNAKIRIDKIGVYNFNVASRRHMHKVNYGNFTTVDRLEFPPSDNITRDYAPNEQVSPITIHGSIDGVVENRFRVHHNLWFPLSDIVSGIVIKQGKTGCRVFPITVTIDSNDKWMLVLFNIVGAKILDKLPPQMD